MDVVRNHIKIALVEAIAHIFKYSLPEIKFLKIEGVIAVTADADVFIVHVDQDYDLKRDKADTSDANNVNLDRGRYLLCHRKFMLQIACMASQIYT